MRRVIVSIAALLIVICVAPIAEAQSLRGSSASLVRQNRAASAHDFTYLETATDVDRFVGLGLLDRLEGNDDYELVRVSFPYARPELRTFIERLARQHRAACGDRLVVTSLTRPQARQPRNASSRSVHPTGMAVDLRRTNNMACRSWLESTLLYLEEQGVLEATRERNPPHYHVAVFPNPYERYLAAGGTEDRTDGDVYIVQRGDSLWEIARRHELTVEELRAANGLRSSRIYAGQLLKIPQGN